MRFSGLWILRKLVVIILFLMTDFIINSGITSCTSYYLKPERNSSENQNFLSDYVSLILNKSRELEDIIYSDILNNLRTLVRTQNNGSESKHECNKNVQTGKVDCSNRNKTGSLDHEYSKNESTINTEPIEGNNRSTTRSVNHSHAPVFDVFLYGKKEKNMDKLPNKNFIPDGGSLKNSFLLGYSGNPFGNQKLIAGVAEMSEADQNDRLIIDPRKKRSVLHLYNMVLCSTGCNPIAYKGYGCYCGFLGSGFVVDGIDSCCKMHDLCYNNAGCPMFLEYFVPYLWKCYHRQPLCAIDYQYYGSSGSCSQRLCECDRQLALCLRKYPCPTAKALCTSSPWREKEKEKEKIREEFQKSLEAEMKLKSKMEMEAVKEKLRLRKDFVRRLELERRQSGLSGVIIKAQEVSILQQKQLEQEEKLAAELDVIRRKEIVEEKMRQHLRENSHELKQLESQLKAAYVTKTLAAQLAEKEEMKLKEQIREKHARAVLEKAIGTLEEQENEQKLQEKKQKENFRQSLQDQIILKERLRQEEFMAFMKEKKMSDDIVQAIKDGEIRELERKKLMQQKLKEEMHMFQKAKDVWKAKERLKIQEEEAKRKEINEEKERAKLKEAKKKAEKESFDKIYEEMSKKMVEKQAKLAEREELVSTLMWNEKEEEEKRKLELEKEKDKLRKEEARSSFKQLLAEKSRKEREEKELDVQFAQIMKAKIDEEEQKEKEKQEQRREALIKNRKYNEEAMKQNIQKRAEGLKLTQLINELQEKEEKRKAEMVEEERIRILKAHAHKLLGYFPKGCLKEKDLEILGLSGNLPSTKAYSVT